MLTKIYNNLYANKKVSTIQKHIVSLVTLFLIFIIISIILKEIISLFMN